MMQKIRKQFDLEALAGNRVTDHSYISLETATPNVFFHTDEFARIEKSNFHLSSFARQLQRYTPAAFLLEQQQEFSAKCRSTQLYQLITFRDDINLHLKKVVYNIDHQTDSLLPFSN